MQFIIPFTFYNKQLLIIIKANIIGRVYVLILGSATGLKGFGNKLKGAIRTIKRLQKQRLLYKLTKIYQIALGLSVRWQIMTHFIAELIATFVTTRFRNWAEVWCVFIIFVINF